MKNIILIGMPGAGKSTIGVLLAKTLGYQFLDSDLVIQERQGSLLQDIIDEKGLDTFLVAEEDAVLSIDVEKTIIATGGSVIYSERAMAHLNNLGTIVYLNVSLEEIERRLNNIKTRGIAMGKHQSLKSLYDERSPLYETYADIKVECLEGCTETVISEICKAMVCEN